jgi:hypothetical protein
MSGEEIVVLTIDREIVEALTFRAGHFDNCDSFKCFLGKEEGPFPGLRRRRDISS